LKKHTPKSGGGFKGSVDLIGYQAMEVRDRWFMFKAKIHVTLKKVILDPQGTAVQKALLSMGYAGVEDVRLGKYMELRINSDDQALVEKQVQEMCQRLLVNPVIEEFTFEVEKL